jgi:hypothetical protein
MLQPPLPKAFRRFYRPQPTQPTRQRNQLDRFGLCGDVMWPAFRSVLGFPELPLESLLNLPC